MTSDLAKGATIISITATSQAARSGLVSLNQKRIKRGQTMNETGFNALCNIAQTVAKEQNIVLELEIREDVILARVVPLDYLINDFRDDDEED